jgi:type IV pilus assembly protein PilC
MPNFTFTARDTAGKWHNGVQAADNTSALASVFRARGWSLVRATPADSSSANAPRSNKRRRGILPVTSLDVEFGLRMLANMLDGGLTLMAALKTCSEQARRQRMANIWIEVHDRIAGGTSFADALSRHRRCFPKLVIQLTRAGEVSGNLEVVLNQAGEQMERKRNLMVTLFSALMYPVFTSVVAIGVTAFLMLKVIPDIAPFITAQGRKLPPVTQALIDTSNFVRAHSLTMGIVIGALVVGLVVAYQWKPAAQVIDAGLLRIPIIGKVFRLAGTSLFARGMAMLLDAGVPVLTALETAGGLMKNQAISRRVEQARLSVLGGNTLARPLAEGREFMPMLARMVAVGEETGTLSGVLIKVADFHEQQLHSFVKRMTLLIEPIMTVVVGSIVGFVYLAFFMAIYSISGG